MFFLKKTRRDGPVQVMAKAGRKIDWIEEAKNYIAAAEKTAKIKGKTVEELALSDGEHHFFWFAEAGGARVLQPEIEGPIRSKIFLEVLKIIGVTWPTANLSGEDTGMETLELDYLGLDEDLESQPEPEPIFFGIGPWKISYTGTRTPSFLEKMQMWWWSFRGELLRFGMIFFALGAVFFSGVTVGSKMHAPVVNATMATQIDKPGSGAWAPAGVER